MSLNRIVLMGRFTAAPELRYTANSIPVVTFTLAVERDRTKDKQTDFITCAAWRNTAEFISNYFVKGSMAAVVGSLQSRQWTDRENNKRTSWEVVVDSIYFAGAKPAVASAGSDAAPSTAFTEISDEDGELPF